MNDLVRGRGSEPVLIDDQSNTKQLSPRQLAAAVISLRLMRHDIEYSRTHFPIAP